MSKDRSYDETVLPPGKMAAEILSAFDYSALILSISLGMSKDDTASILDGSLEITPVIADKLAKALGPSAKVWLTLETQYREGLALQSEQGDGYSKGSLIALCKAHTDSTKSWAGSYPPDGADDIRYNAECDRKVLVAFIRKFWPKNRKKVSL